MSLLRAANKAEEKRAEEWGVTEDDDVRVYIFFFQEFTELTARVWYGMMLSRCFVR